MLSNIKTEYKIIEKYDPFFQMKYFEVEKKSWLYFQYEARFINKQDAEQYIVENETLQMWGVYKIFKTNKTYLRKTI